MTTRAAATAAPRSTLRSRSERSSGASATTPMTERHHDAQEMTMRYLMLSILLAPAIAAAEPRLELGLASGEHAFSKTDELGVADQANEPGPEDAAMVGIRAAIGFTPRWALEGEAMY